MSKLNVTNVEVGNVATDGTGAHGQYCWLSCHCNGARYHVWVNPTNHSDVRPELFKNSTKNRYEPGFFETRHLRIDSAFSQELINLMLHVAECDNLFELAKHKAIEKQAEEELIREVANNRARIRDAAQDLYEALIGLSYAADSMGDRYCFCTFPRADQDAHTPECSKARAALAKAEGKV